MSMNGAGKTTLIKLLLRFYEPSEGKITLNGIEIGKYDYEEYIKIFAVVFQDFRLYHFPLDENIAGSEKVDEKRVWKVIRQVGLEERVKKMKDGIHTLLYHETGDGEALSGGEAQKVAIARALYKDAPFVILDEPTAALDPVAESEIYENFNELINGKTAIYISHRMSSCKFCDTIVVLEEGTVAESGNHQTLMEKKGKYFALYEATGTVLCEEESGRRGIRNFIKKELCSYPILVIIGIKIKISQSLKQREICERKSNVRKESDCEVSISKNQEEYKMKVTNDIIYVGVNDHQVDLFEGQYVVPNGMSYNSYVIKDEKIAVMDTVDVNFAEEWLANIAQVLDGAKPDYLIVQHMEPDHSANIYNFMKVYPDTTIVANEKTFVMMANFFREMDLEGRTLEVENGQTLSLGKHDLTFVFAPMVHWPEVMVTYDSTEKVLFSADGFGKFGANDVEEDWDDEARRYYIGIVGKYGTQVQNLLKVAATLDIQMICPLHGPILKENLGHYIEKYDIWSSYAVEKEGVMIAYTSVYGNTKKAAETLAAKLEEKGCPDVYVCDLARADMARAVENAFSYGKLVLATTTYNADIFPFMKIFY
mgnify:CR=1 FL=1